MSVSVAIDAIQDAMESVTRRKWLTTVGLNPSALPVRITPEEHMQLALHIGTLDDVSAWARGDQVVIIQNDIRALMKKYDWPWSKYGEEINNRYIELLKLYRSVELKTLLNNAATARRWPYATRRQSPTIGYGHHAELNGYTPKERDDYLEMVEAHHWTVAQLRAELYKNVNTVTPAHSAASPARIMDIFRLLDLPVQIDPNRATFTLRQAQRPGSEPVELRIVVESNSELIWRIEAL